MNQSTILDIEYKTCHLYREPNEFSDITGIFQREEEELPEGRKKLEGEELSQIKCDVECLKEKRRECN